MEVPHPLRAAFEERLHSSATSLPHFEGYFERGQELGPSMTEQRRIQWVDPFFNCSPGLEVISQYSYLRYMFV